MIQLKNEDNIIIATARNTASSAGLQALRAQYPPSKLHLVDLDVSRPESIRAAVTQTVEILGGCSGGDAKGGLDHLISNAGVSYNALKTFDEMYGPAI